MTAAHEAEELLDAMVRESAIKKLAALALSMSANAENVPSPCISVCRMDAEGGLCEGCFRTIDDIRDWSRSTDAAKRRVWMQITERLRQTHPNVFA